MRKRATFEGARSPLVEGGEGHGVLHVPITVYQIPVDDALRTGGFSTPTPTMLAEAVDDSPRKALGVAKETDVLTPSPNTRRLNPLQEYYQA